MSDGLNTHRPSRHLQYEWMTAALCAEIGHQPFYPEREQPNGRADHRPALTICARCPVQLDCLRHALEHDERYGVWGGTTEDQRAQMRKLRRKP